MRHSEIDIKWYADWRFWLLVISINISGNPGFNILFPYYATLTGLFVGLLSYILIQRQIINKPFFIYILLWVCLFLFHGYYIKEYELSSAIHVVMKVTIGILVLLVVNNKFTKYYSDIIYFFCILSLLCFAYNHIIGVLPYIDLGGSMDGGNGFRVTSIVYTQLYNLNVHGLTFRNCGPFWEPGAFQGFINLAIIIELLGHNERNRKWYVRMLILAITVLSTFSTGGYIVLALCIIYLVVSDRLISNNNKMILLIFLLSIALAIFFRTDFLYEKISKDQGRLGTTTDDLFSNNILYTLFGYGFAGESIAQSSIKSAGSVLNLFRYTGMFGVLLYYIPLVGVQVCLKKLFYALTIFLIMMNEPFITAGIFWWGIPLLFPYIDKKDGDYEFFA